LNNSTILEKNKKEKEKDIKGTKKIAQIFCKEGILFS
jgi:hypothetical protein